jgi:FKBP-type peptidyl-prolyl cis-trans isomerase FkpA
MRRLLPIALFLLLSDCGGQPPPASTPPATAGVSRLESVELKPGTGAAIVAGQTAVVNYTGWLYDASAPDHKGKQFDSSVGTGMPFRFPLGAGQVIRGWDEGVLGMQVGAERRLTIPADLGYGDRGAADVIPPGATLVFDVELVAIE